MLPIPQQTAARQAAGVVVSAGKMMGTVKVRIAKQVWNKRVKKYYNDYDTVMVSDPASSTREGDVVTVRRTQRISQHVRHVVAGIVAPMGTPISSRPSVPSEEVLTARREAKRAAKDERQ
ncbi:nucleic acid-binding protein, partial [Trichodelitschia bisporula]